MGKDFLIVLSCVTVIAATTTLLHSQNPPPARNIPLSPSPTQIPNPEPALIDHVPSFESLSVDNLPNFRDVRRIYSYQEHSIITGVGLVVEYDPVNKKYIRQSSSLLNCLVSSEKIGDFLYVGCQTPDAFSEIGQASTLYKIDLQSGLVAKTYFGQIGKTDRKVNIHLASKETNLWISSWDGVVKLDTITDKSTSYSNFNLFKKACRSSGIFNDNGNITVLTAQGSDCSTGVSIYNETSNTWQLIDTNPNQYANNHNLHWTIDSNYHLPSFLAVSQFSQGRYYILADDGIYTLTPNSFPSRIIISKSYYPGLSPNSLVTNDQRYLIFTGYIPRGPDFNPPKISDLISALLVDLEKGQVVDLLKPHEFQRLANSNFDKFLIKFEHSYLEENGGIVDIKEEGTQTTLGTISPSEAKLTLFIP